MRRSLALLAAGAALAMPGYAAAQTDGPCLISLDSAPPTAPQFKDYPAAPSAVAKPAPVDLKSAPGARRFGSKLREGAKEGPNFAGHYTLVGWGCGSGCSDWAIVDAQTGAVSMPKPIRAISVANVGEDKIPHDANADAYALRFRRDSTLLVILGAPGEDEKQDGIAYYRWTGRALERLLFLPYAKLCPGDHG